MPVITNMDSLAGGLAPAAVEWPLKLTLWNNNHLLGVEPETCTVAQPYGRAEITLKDEGQLARVLSNIEQLKAVNEWAEGVGLHLLAPPKEAAEAPAAEAPAAEAPAAEAPPAAEAAPAQPPAPAPAGRRRQ